jgi:glycosyltransferase involved in cell wall biosynthesis
MLPKFSVLMANYNNGEYISEAIESVLNQSFPDWELIIIDDNSNDNSVEKIGKYLNDSRIRFIKNKKNVGYTTTLIKLVSKARSKIFGTLDSDDTLTPDALKKLLESKLGHPVEHFSYPFGTKNEVSIRDVNLVKESGFKTAVIAENKSFYINGNIYCLPRQAISFSDSIDTLKVKLSGWTAYLGIN